MNDRRRLLLFSVLILCAVTSASVGITLHQLAVAEAAVGATNGLPSAIQHPSTTIALGAVLVIMTAGGALLLRAMNPFICRLQESEARTRAILNTAVDGIITVDERGFVESVNLAAEQLFGYQRMEVVGQHVNLLMDWPNAQRLAELATTYLGRSTKGVIALEHAVLGRRRDGSVFSAELSLSEVRLDSRRIVTGIVRDVTERKAAQDQTRLHMAQLQAVKERLEAKATELARMNRELDEFTYVASHDLKEPLRGISGYCQILLEDYSSQLDAAGQRRLQANVALCARLTQLIDDLLAYHQISRRRPAEDQIELAEVVADVIATLGPAIDRRGGAVLILGALPRIKADPTMLGELLRNLISNGLKFNENPRPLIEIGCSSDGLQTIYVRDNGIGIPPEQQDAIFTMFRRLHSQKKYEGTGVGLAIVRKIVESHGGVMWIESQPGSGSTFYFNLTGAERAPHEPALSAVG